MDDSVWIDEITKQLVAAGYSPSTRGKFLPLMLSSVKKMGFNPTEDNVETRVAESLQLIKTTIDFDKYVENPEAQDTLQEQVPIDNWDVDVNASFPDAFWKELLAPVLNIQNQDLKEKRSNDLLASLRELKAPAGRILQMMESIAPTLDRLKLERGEAILFNQDVWDPLVTDTVNDIDNLTPEETQRLTDLCMEKLVVHPVPQSYTVNTLLEIVKEKISSLTTVAPLPKDIRLPYINSVLKQAGLIGDQAKQMSKQLLAMTELLSEKEITKNSIDRIINEQLADRKKKESMNPLKRQQDDFPTHIFTRPVTEVHLLLQKVLRKNELNTIELTGDLVENFKKCVLAESKKKTFPIKVMVHTPGKSGDAKIAENTLGGKLRLSWTEVAKTTTFRVGQNIKCWFTILGGIVHLYISIDEAEEQRKSKRVAV